MVINSDHKSWITGSAVATVVAAAGYAYYASATPYGPSGGSWPGLFFGIVGTSFMVIAGLLSARKKLLIRRLGSAQLWMKMHIWLSLLAVPFILFHSGFGWGGPLTTVLMILFYVVILSGIFGLVLQQFVPAMMTARVPLETIHSQIDYVAAGLAVDAYDTVVSVAGAIPEAVEEQKAIADEEALLKIRAGNWKQIRRLGPPAEPAPGSTALKAFYLQHVRAYLRRGIAAPGTLPDFHQIRLEAPEEWRQQVEKLYQLCEESRQLSVQLRLHGLLHNWLLLHAPLSFAMFVLAAFHIVYALQY